MGVTIHYSKSYFWLKSWAAANIIQLGTQSFCHRFIDYRTDPCHRLYDQMVMAARSAVANIAEGTSRHDTSIETEMRLTDVARGSIDELFGNYFNFLVSNKYGVWRTDDPNVRDVWNVSVDKPMFSKDLFHDVADYIIAQKAKYDPWIESDSPEICANALLLLCERLNRMLQNMMDSQLEAFRKLGGFTENMTQERLAKRKAEAAAANAPKCPRCGKPMQRRMIKKGERQGQEFWGCIDYPRCIGLRNI